MSSHAAPPQQQDDIRVTKQAVRQRVKGLLRGLSEQDMASESQAISQHVLAWPTFSAASQLGVYVHCAKLREVDTSAILAAALAAGKRCYVPVVKDKSSNMDLVHLDDMSELVSVPPFGIMEPTEHHKDGRQREDVMQAKVHLDVLLMPGLGFDRTGHRLGRGGGYYDKMLSALQQQAAAAGREPPLLVALAYSAQLVEAVPVDAHDRPVDLLVTSEGILACSERGRSACS